MRGVTVWWLEKGIKGRTKRLSPVPNELGNMHNYNVRKTLHGKSEPSTSVQYVRGRKESLSEGKNSTNEGQGGSKCRGDGGASSGTGLGSGSRSTSASASASFSSSTSDGWSTGAGASDRRSTSARTSDSRNTSIRRSTGRSTGSDGGKAETYNDSSVRTINKVSKSELTNTRILRGLEGACELVGADEPEASSNVLQELLIGANAGEVKAIERNV